MRVSSAAGIGISFLMLMIGNALCKESRAARDSVSAACPVRSAARSILVVGEKWCDLNGSEFDDVVGVVEGGETTLTSVINMVHSNSHDYVALLLYASWCPFSVSCKPNYSILSALYPNIPHFSIEESSIRPSILSSRYGVHGFPTLFLINSTMRARYRGSRTVQSLVAFYSDVTGVDPVTLNITAGFAAGSHSDLKSHGTSEPEICPFSKARSPVNVLQQETYLALAMTFVIMRLVYAAYPSINAFSQYVWAKHARGMRLTSLWEHPRTCMKGALHLINLLKAPFKKRNLQAPNPKAWASKSLASVTISDTSSSSSLSASVSDLEL